MNMHDRIRRETEVRVAECAAGGTAAIDERLEALDREKDVDQRFMIGAATATAVGLTLGSFVHRRFLIIPAVAATFLAARGIFGWAPPPVRVMRRFGARTRDEIENERYALKAMRGDFRDLPAVPDPNVADSSERIVRATEPRPARA